MWLPPAGVYSLRLPRVCTPISRLPSTWVCPFFLPLLPLIGVPGPSCKGPKRGRGREKRQVFSVQGGWGGRLGLRVRNHGAGAARGAPLGTNSAHPHLETCWPRWSCEVNLGGRGIGGLRRTSEDGRYRRWRWSALRTYRRLRGWSAVPPGGGT